MNSLRFSSADELLVLDPASLYEALVAQPELLTKGIFRLYQEHQRANYRLHPFLNNFHLLFHPVVRKDYMTEEQAPFLAALDRAVAYCGLSVREIMEYLTTTTADPFTRRDAEEFLLTVPPDVQRPLTIDDLLAIAEAMAEISSRVAEVEPEFLPCDLVLLDERIERFRKEQLGEMEEEALRNWIDPVHMMLVPVYKRMRALGYSHKDLTQ